MCEDRCGKRVEISGGGGGGATKQDFDRDVLALVSRSLAHTRIFHDRYAFLHLRRIQLRGNSNRVSQ